MTDPADLSDEDLVEALGSLDSKLTSWEMDRVEEWTLLLESGGELGEGRRAKAEEIYRDRT